MSFVKELIRKPDRGVKCCLAVDPGQHTAWALFDDQPSGPAMYGQFDCEFSRPDFLQRMSDEFDTVLDTTEPDELVIEGIEVYAGSATSMTSASQGHLTKLSYLIGMYAHCALTIDKYIKIKINIVPARVWKGQLTKGATESWITRIEGDDASRYPTEHIYDAVALGYAWWTDEWLHKIDKSNSAIITIGE